MIREHLYKFVLKPNYGVCVPDVCTEEDIVNNIDTLISIPALSWLSLTSPTFGGSPVQCELSPQRPYDAGFVCFTIFCLVLLLLMLAGAALDVFQRRQKRKSSQQCNPRTVSSYQKYNSTSDSNAKGPASFDENIPIRNGYEPNNIVRQNGTSSMKDAKLSDSKSRIFQEIILCFAFNRNLRKVLHATQSDKTIGCLNGIRVISLSWVVLGHVFIMSLIGSPDNPIQLLNMVETFSFQAVANAFLSVDTFFLMSGFLMSYLTLSRLVKSNGKLSLVCFYFHRIWRLTPLYAFVILFMIYLHPYFGNGPVWRLATHFDALCEKYWWRNLLYINNFFSGEDMCMQWSWYMASDMQFFIISPLIILPLFSVPIVGLVITVCILVANWAITGSLIGLYDLTPNVFGVMNGLDQGQKTSETSYFEMVYSKPYCRIGPYLVGIVLGYFFHKQVTERKKIYLSPVTVASGWALASAVALVVLYGTYPSYGSDSKDPWTTAQCVIYGMFNTFSWSLALSWVLIACHYGYGGWINDFLCWSFWIPLSRLTYSAYLVHGLVIYTFYQSAHKPLHYSPMSAAYTFCGFLMLSYAAALLFSLAIEYPCANLEKMLLRRRKGDNGDMVDNEENKPLLGTDNKQTSSA